MRDWNKEAVIGLLVECGRIGLAYYDDPGREFKSDRSLVTAADRAIEERLTEVLHDPPGGSYLIGEETAADLSEQDVDGAFANVAWIVDPIDGTAPYAHHVPTWGISIGMMKEGVLEEGAIFLPATGEVFVSDGDRVYHGVSGAHRDWDFSGIGEIEVKVRSLDDGGMIALTQSIAKGAPIALPNPVQALCCAVMPLPYLCLGRYLAYVGSLKLWDIAGGLALLLKCGLSAKLLTGEPICERVSGDIYFLEPGHPRRWSTKGPAIFAPTEEIADKIGAVFSQKQ